MQPSRCTANRTCRNGINADCVVKNNEVATLNWYILCDDKNPEKLRKIFVPAQDTKKTKILYINVFLMYLMRIYMNETIYLRRFLIKINKLKEFDAKMHLQN